MDDEVRSVNGQRSSGHKRHRRLCQQGVTRIVFKVNMMVDLRCEAIPYAKVQRSFLRGTQMAKWI